MIQSIQNSEFGRNVIKLISGAGLAQIIMLLASPALTRIYTPTDFAALAIFVSIVNISVVFVSAKYEMSILLPESDLHACWITQICVMLTVLFSCIFSIFFWGGRDFFYVSVFEYTDITYVLLLVLSISFIGLYNSISYFLLRLKRYGLLSVSKFIRSVIIVATQLVFVLFYDKSIYGLIVGFTLGQIFSSAFLLVFSAKQIFCSRVEWSFFVKVLSKYKKFPLFYLPSFSCNIASREIVVILMSQVFNPIYIGYYALVNRVVGSPLSIVGDSFGQVFFQKYSESYRKKLDLELFFKSSLKKLIVLSLVGFGIIAILSPTVFGFVFGKEWEVCGKYVILILPLYFFRFISSPLSNILTVHEKQKSALVISAILLVSNLFILKITDYLSLAFTEFLVIYSVTLGLEYFGFILYYRKIVEKVSFENNN